MYDVQGNKEEKSVGVRRRVSREVGGSQSVSSSPGLSPDLPVCVSRSLANLAAFTASVESVVR